MGGKFGIFAFAALILAACGVEALAPKEDVDFAKQYFALFQTGDYDAITAKIDPKLRDAKLRPTLEKMAGFFPQGTPIKVTLIEWNSTTPANGPRTEAFKFYYEFTYQKLLASVIFEKHGDERVVTGVYVEPAPTAAASPLSFDHLTAIKIAFLALMGIIPLFILVTLAICIRTKMSNWKWLWCFLILFGLVAFSLDWANDEVVVKPIAVLLFGAALNDTSLGASGASVSVSIPLGAILFLILRRRWRRRAVENTLQQF